jgi:hypothetical protein
VVTRYLPFLLAGDAYIANFAMYATPDADTYYLRQECTTCSFAHLNLAGLTRKFLFEEYGVRGHSGLTGLRLANPAQDRRLAFFVVRGNREPWELSCKLAQ